MKLTNLQKKFSDILRKKKKKIIFLLVIAAAMFLYHKVLWGDLRNNGIILVGIVKSSSFHAKSSDTDFQCTFDYKGKKYESECSADVTSSSIFIGKTFPVILSEVTNNSKMLITPDHFKSVNIPFPDSLKWVLQYVR